MQTCKLCARQFHEDDGYVDTRDRGTVCAGCATSHLEFWGWCETWARWQRLRELVLGSR